MNALFEFLIPGLNLIGPIKYEYGEIEGPRWESSTIDIPSEILRIQESHRFALDVAQELTRARKKHPAKMNSAHEGIAVLEEEFLEVKDEVYDRAVQYADCGDDGFSTGTPCTKEHRIYEELVQTAAMCQRMAEDVILPKLNRA